VKRLRRLDVRLFGSYALVVVVVVAALVLTFAFRAPTLFADRIRNAGEAGPTETESHHAFATALWSTLPIALVVSALAAAIVTAFVTRQILRPIAAVRRATGRLAAGRYDERVVEPTSLELAALAADVNRLAEALQHTETRRARLIGEVAHEMRTPLTAINGYVEGILDGVFEPTEEILTSVGEEATRLQRLATDLATLSRAEEGALELRLGDADLHELAGTATARLRPQYDDKGVTLELEPGPVVPVHVDRDRIVQVLTNLVGNALTYTPTGGTVVVRTRVDHGTASATVSDNGVGISATDLPLVFERFFRVPGLDRPTGGSGIGLTVATGIAHAHHGDIRAASAGLGAGATFTLELPSGDQAA
jgi:histidine kinase